MSARGFALAASSLLLAFPAGSVLGQIDHAHHDAGSAPSAIGRVAFPTSCSANAQIDFEKGMALLHSFWYEEAAKEFTATSTADRTCSMAHWGHAMSLFHQLWEAPDSAVRRQVIADLDGARRSGSPTLRERAYIEALAQYFELKPKAPPDTVTSDARMQAYLHAMERVAHDYPADDEAAIFYGLALVAAAPYGDTTFTNARRADSILLPLARKYPTHPGVMHYIIHANDAPPLAHLALDAARRYAQLAPAIPHAQHMPSHIFIQLGLWDDVIASNVLATESGAVYERQEHMDGVWWHNLHTMDFLQYAYLQEGRDADAQRIADKISRIDKTAPPNQEQLRSFQAFIVARQAFERGQWHDAAVLRVKTQPDTTAHWSVAMLGFTHALGAARSGDSTLARSEIAGLDSLERRDRQKNDTLAANYMETMRTEASAWLELARGNREQAVRFAAQASARENDASETPLIPAPELEGELLLAVGRPAEARRAFETSLQRHPNRARSLFGAARAAALAGDGTSAARLYAQYIALMAHGDGARPELQTAKQFVAAR